MRPEGGTLQVIDRLDWGSARSFVLDTMAAALVRVLHAAVGSLPAGLRLDVPLPRPAWAAHYERALPLPLQFGQPTLALHVPAAALRLPLLGADARAHAAACHECDAALAELVQSWCNCKVERFLRMVIVIDFAFSRVKQRKQLIRSYFIYLLSFWLSQTSLEKNKQPSHHLIIQIPLLLQ
jgi:hypothetical protein